MLKRWRIRRKLNELAKLCVELELVEDRLRDRVARLGAPLVPQPARELGVAVVRVEHTPDDQLRSDGPVPAVLLEAEHHVVAAGAPQPVEVGAHPERDRAAAVAAVLAADAEAQVLAVADRREVAQLAAGREQCDAGIAEPERRELRELLREFERERHAARDDRI